MKNKKVEGEFNSKWNLIVNGDCKVIGGLRVNI
jgi:hypothetical protein